VGDEETVAASVAITPGSIIFWFIPKTIQMKLPPLLGPHCKDLPAAVADGPTVLFSSTAALATTAGPCSAPAIPVPNSNVCAPPVFSNFGATDVFTVDQHIRTPYVQNYNLNIQQQLAAGVVLQIGYIGSAGRKLFRYRDVNQSGGGPIPYPDFVYINQFESTANSNYNGLQTTLC
jgi:hypothetical protein